MGCIWFTSDLHFGHDRAFIYSPRGFTSVEEMNLAIQTRWNQVIDSRDEVYILGDLMLGNNSMGMELLSTLNGQLHIIRGNHDTDARIELYKTLSNVVEICDAKFLKIDGYHFYLTHFPCFTGNLEKEALKQMTLNLSGHTHSTNKFYMDCPFIYNVAVDAHNCYPINFETIIHDMKEKIIECQKYL